MANLCLICVHLWQDSLHHTAAVDVDRLAVDVGGVRPADDGDLTFEGEH